MRLKNLLYTTALFFLYGISSAWYSNGLTDYGGLFLLDQPDKAFSASYVQITDSVQHENLLVFAGYQYFKYDAFWKDFGTLSLNQKQHLGNAGFLSRSRYFSLGVYASTLPWLSSSFGIHTPDSIFFAETKIGTGEPTITKITWDPEEENELVSTIQVSWKSYLFNRSFGVGSLYQNHLLYGKIARLQSTPKNRDETRYIRDSVDIYSMQLRYQLSLNKWLFNLQYFHVKSNAYLVGIHKQEEDTKRFIYLPLNSNLNFLMANLEHSHWLFRGALGNFDLGIQKENRRFYETLALNRLLSASVLQALSFGFLQKNYRVSGSVKGAGALAGLAYYWDIPIGKWTLVPKLGNDFFWVKGNAQMTLESITTKMVTSIAKVEEYYWNLKSFGTNTNLSIALKSPHSRFYVQAKASQIIPFYFKNDKKHFLMPPEKLGETGPSTPSEKPVEIKPVDKSKNHFSIKPFRNGFSGQMQIGISF